MNWSLKFNLKHQDFLLAWLLVSAEGTWYFTSSVPPISRCTDEIFQALEDNQVSLSTMKASHFVRAFEQEVDRWERQLSVVLEVTEMVLTVQRQWIYLEVMQ